MADAILHIRQEPADNGKHRIRLSLERSGQPDIHGDATIEFALTDQEQGDLKWYMEDYLQRASSVEVTHVEQVERLMKERGEELYQKVLTGNPDFQAIWYAIREQLADLRIEITTGISDAASVPWELMRDPQSQSPIAVRVKSFVRVQSNPNISFVSVPQSEDGRIRILYVVCRPGGRNDVPLRVIANRLLQDLGEDLNRFEITALRPPTFEQLQKVLTDAKQAGKPYHIVHFDGHGMYADLEQHGLAHWLKAINSLMLGAETSGKHGYLLFEHPGDDKMRPVSGQELGKLLHDTGVPVLVLNACQSAMHEAAAKPESADNVHDEVRAIGSLSQAVIDQGIPAVLGMRYSVFVVTAAQYIGQLYASLAKGRGFGQAATEGRKHLHNNPDRWVGLEPRPLQDWFVPVVYEAMPLILVPAEKSEGIGEQRELDPVQIDPSLLRYVPDTGFIGRDETLLSLDRAFDTHPIVLLHAYAGQGKTTTVVEFARWYARTGGLGPQPLVLLTSFESHTDLDDVLNQIGRPFAPILQAHGIEWHAINDTDKRRQLVVQLLRQIPVLWIWDNVEPVAGFPEGTPSAWPVSEQTDLKNFLKLLKEDRATKAKILLTSRRDEQLWLGGIPHQVQMRRMSLTDAANLALQLGGENQQDRAEVANWQPLLDYCAGNPLTLRVIAGQAVRMGLSGRDSIERFVQAVRDGEQHIEDADEAQGRDKSLGASLDYGFKHAFKEDELPVIALLHLFQGTVDVDALDFMGQGEHALPEMKGKTKEHIAGLLNRAAETGLLTHIGSTYYAIHPALPWFLKQRFDRHYDGQARHSSAEVALLAWVKAVGATGDYYHDQYVDGHRKVISTLAMEEANLLHARRIAYRNGWWSRVINTMQGLRILYEHQGRGEEWKRLVNAIVPDYCTADDKPMPGRDGQYGLFMTYRVNIAQRQDRDLDRAIALQERAVAWSRSQATSALALPGGAPLDKIQRNRIRSLAMSTGTLGQILRERGSNDCVAAYKETIQLTQRIKDTAGEATAHYNLGHAYMTIPDIRDLDAAEAAYQRSIDLRDRNDALGRARCISQQGMVHYERFKEGHIQDEPTETLLKHLQTAGQYYLQAMDLYPASAITELGAIHNQMGVFHTSMGETELARKYFEKSAQCFEQSGDPYRAGSTRYNIAAMYEGDASQEQAPTRQQELFLRARAYARAALHDFQYYQGRAAKDEDMVQQLIDVIDHELAKLGKLASTGGT